MTVKRALLSVYDKTDIVELASFLQKKDFEIISSGGTFRVLEDAGISVTSVSSVTGFPEILNGRVKTLHPKIHAGILAMRTEDHISQLESLDISPIDLVVVNLYPFEATIRKEGITPEEAIEQIDIGGPTLIRAAAKNHDSVTVLTDPSQYKPYMESFEQNKGAIPDTFRRNCARDVFRIMAHYNQTIASYFETLAAADEEEQMPDRFTLSGNLEQILRYGENPHQKAGFYRYGGKKPLGDMQQLHGKELSFNNILDLQAALSIVQEFEQPTCVIIKHNNPCGVATGSSLIEAHKQARKTDESSAFGGIIAVNGPVTLELAESFAEYFVECIIAPEFSQEALQRLTRKKNLRLLIFDPAKLERAIWDLKTVAGGFLVQGTDDSGESIRDARVVTKRKPTEQEWQAMEFAWKITKHVKSNAIVFTNDSQTLGIGAGQMSRVDSTEIAIMKAGKAGLSLRQSTVASDAFFPFRDSIEALAEAGATAVIEPGGSIRDEEVIEAADEAGITMVFTGTRHFKH